MRVAIDLNCDLGESFGTYKLGKDEELIRFVSSVNIACGFHAGDYNVMNETVQLAQQNQVSIGAHPGFYDVLGFGRRKIEIHPKEVYNLVLYQIGALYSFCRSHHASLTHVKPHGALYNMAAKDESLAYAIAKAIYDFDPKLLLYGLSGSELIRQGQKVGLRTISEVFADRTYQKDGSLTPRSKENALLHSFDQVKEQMLSIIFQQKVKTIEGIWIPIEADSICIHGDGEHAISFARNLNQLLINEGVQIKSPE
jgi:5-oxoprolinase (ATP-hydrolysing) subunit A